MERSACVEFRKKRTTGCVLEGPTHHDDRASRTWSTWHGSLARDRFVMVGWNAKRTATPRSTSSLFRPRGIEWREWLRFPPGLLFVPNGAIDRVDVDPVDRPWPMLFDVPVT